MDEKINLMWFRNDLRVKDNLALYHAQQLNLPTIGICILTPTQWKKHHWGDVKVSFYLENLKYLKQELEKLNIPLIIEVVNSFENCVDVFYKLLSDFEIQNVFYNLEYEVNEIDRDEIIKDLLGRHKIKVHEFHDQIIFDLNLVKTQQGTPYSVYSPFRKTWASKFEELNIKIKTNFKKQNSLSLKSSNIPEQLQNYNLVSCKDLGFEAGEKAAENRLKKFLNQSAFEYKDKRDFPNTLGTSRISPYLAIGAISPRVCYIEAAKALEKSSPLDQKHIRKWMDELLWREFYRYILIHFPKVCKNQNFQEKTNQIKWNQDKDNFKKWCEGKTGIPIVDAGMRELNQTGWMHNRVRMIVAMFLTKNLFIDWRWGEKYFMEKLIDADFANNNGGWQWSASTGTDAAPYFRIFNPESQASKFDPEAKYIKSYVEELKNLDPKEILNSENLTPIIRESIGYPQPICELKETRKLAIEKFRKL